MRKKLACDYSNLSKEFICVQKYITNQKAKKTSFTFNSPIQYSEKFLHIKNDENEKLEK